MDRTGIVAGIVDRCKSLIVGVLDDPDLATAPAASLALFEKFRDVCREILQAWVDERVERLAEERPERCSCGSLTPGYVNTGGVTVKTLFGDIVARYRRFRCAACKAYLRPDDRELGIPEEGIFADDVRALYEPLAAELPHRTANDIFLKFTGVDLSSRGGQSIIDSTSRDLMAWREDREAGEVFRVSSLLARGEDLVLELAMDGVMAHIDGAWHEAKVGTIQVRRRGEKTAEGTPKLGRVEARRYACVRGSADELAAEIQRTIREAGWGEMPIAEILGDGAPWIWNLAENHFPGVAQTLDTWHLKEHLYEFANALHVDPCRAKAWVQMKMEALREDRVGDVLGGLKKMKPGNKDAREAQRGLIVYLQNNKGRIRYKEPWEEGLAVGSGSVEGACKHLVQSRFKRAGMRWKTPGFLSVVELRVSRLNGTDREFWASRGLFGRTAA
jgi:hypothetical protein